MLITDEEKQKHKDRCEQMERSKKLEAIHRAKLALEDAYLDYVDYVGIKDAIPADDVRTRNRYRNHLLEELDPRLTKSILSGLQRRGKVFVQSFGYGSRTKLVWSKVLGRVPKDKVEWEDNGQ